MPAGYVNIKIESGASFSIDMELNNADGSNLDLTGYTGACKIRKSYYSNFNVYSLTVVVANPPTDGKIIISSTASETATFKPGRYVYDVEISSGSSVTRVVEGIAEVTPNATR
jgi:hypothetical protein